MAAIDRWLTPDTPASDFICRRLLIPNSVEFLAIVKGALLPLIYAFNFEQYGTLTPAQTASYFQDMFADFSRATDRTCRMIGEIIPYAGSTIPDPAWLDCDGTSYLRADYPALFAVVGTIYGSVDGSHFNVPDLRGRTILGVGTGSGLSTYNLGDQGGEEAHALTSAENGPHSHGYITNGVPIITAPGALPTDSSPGTAAFTASDGSGTAHNTLQPYLALNYYIVAQ